MAILGIIGYAGVGKDTVGNMIKYLSCPQEFQSSHPFESLDFIADDWLISEQQPWETKKWAGKLKTIASLLTGIPVENFEDQEFKKALLGPEWGTITKTPLSAIPVFEDVQFNSLMSVRDLLQKLGTDAMRNGLHPNTWVNALMADYTAYPKGKAHDLKDYSEVYTHNACESCGKAYLGYKRQHLCKECIEDDSIQLYPKWVITDTRFPNEADAIKQKGGILIRVTRLGVGPVNDHPSETALDDYDEDYVVSNVKDYDYLLSQLKLIMQKENLL